MATNDYHFVSHWTVPGTVDEVSDVLGDAAGLARWWSKVYLDVRVREPGDEHGVGKVVDVRTKGRLPYTISWSFRVTESHAPHGFSIRATGDFDGTGRWDFVQQGESVAVTYDWRLRAQKPLLRRLSFLLKPVFAANHRWAMARGEEGLRRELARRRAARPSEAAPVV
jgi:hypothetical protein